MFYHFCLFAYLKTNKKMPTNCRNMTLIWVNWNGRLKCWHWIELAIVFSQSNIPSQWRPFSFVFDFMLLLMCFDLLYCLWDASIYRLTTENADFLSNYIKIKGVELKWERAFCIIYLEITKTFVVMVMEYSNLFYSTSIADCWHYRNSCISCGLYCHY